MVCIVQDRVQFDGPARIGATADGRTSVYSTGKGCPSEEFGECEMLWAAGRYAYWEPPS